MRNLKTIKSFRKVFEDLSDLLLNQTLLVIGGVKYKIIEIEFYVNDYKYHLDTYATPNLLTTERTKGQWLIRNKFNAKFLEVTIGEALSRDSTSPAGTIRINSIISLD